MTSSLGFSLLIKTRNGLLAWIGWSICILKFQRILCISFFRRYSGLYIYHLSVWLNFYVLHNSQWIIIPTQSCLVLYFFSVSLLHSLMWLTISSLSPYNLHLVFFCILLLLLLQLKSVFQIKFWFGMILWYINHCRLFNAKSFLYIYIKYIWFGLVGFYSISTFVGYLMPKPFS